MAKRRGMRRGSLKSCQGSRHAFDKRRKRGLAYYLMRRSSLTQTRAFDRRAIIAAHSPSAFRNLGRGVF